MEQEYTVSTGWKIFYGLLAVGLMIFAIILGNMPTTVQSKAILLIPLVFGAGGILILVNIFKRKVTIYSDSVRCVNLFSTKELAVSDIKGCRIGQKAIFVEPVDGSGSKITISNYSDLTNSDDLVAYFRDNFKNLDAIDLAAEQNAVLEDPSLGFTKEDRERKLKTAKQVALAYNIVGPVASFGLLLLSGNRAAAIVGLIYPLLAIFIMKFSNGLIKFVGNNKRSVIPFLVIGFTMPAMVMFFVSLGDYHVFQYNNLWFVIILVTMVVLALIYFTGINTGIGGTKGQLFLMLVLCFLYGYGSSVDLNCTFDNSPPTVYKAAVLAHRVESGKHTSYLFTLSEWGPMHKEKEEDVGKWIYDHVSVGDSVKIYFRQGKLKAPWYQVHSFAYTGNN